MAAATKPGAKEASAALLSALGEGLAEPYVFRHCDNTDEPGEECPPRETRMQALRQVLARHLDPAGWERIKQACPKPEDGDELPSSCQRLLEAANDRVDAAFGELWTRGANAAWTRFGLREERCREIPNCHSKDFSDEEEIMNCRSQERNCGMVAHTLKQSVALQACIERQAKSKRGSEACAPEVMAMLTKFEKRLRKPFSAYGIPEAYGLDLGGQLAELAAELPPSHMVRRAAEAQTAYETLQDAHQLLAATRNPQTVRRF